MFGRSAPKTPALDPVLTAIIRNRLAAIAEEMAQTLMMTSRSGIFAEARDFVTGICDARRPAAGAEPLFPGLCLRAALSDAAHPRQI